MGCGIDSTLLEGFDATAGGEQFWVHCSCGYETPERTSEAEAWRDHDEHAFPAGLGGTDGRPLSSGVR